MERVSPFPPRDITVKISTNITAVLSGATRKLRRTHEWTA